MKRKMVKERRLKRIFDIAGSAFLLVVLSPLFILFALLLKLEGLFNPRFRGPVFFKETRISKGRPFQLYKFRTVDSPTLKLLAKAKGTESITHFICLEDNYKHLTPVGRFIDRIYFDELPQLFNVLKGDMSIVGPRPHILIQYNSDIRSGTVSAKYIKGGIMGLVQASKKKPELRKAFVRMALTHSSGNHEIVLIDRLYFRKYLKDSALEMLFFDISIIYKCLLVILDAKGA